MLTGINNKGMIVGVAEETSGKVHLSLLNADGSTTVGLEEKVKHSSKEFLLLQNYPNPVNSSTTISYQLPVKSHVTLLVLDALGREVTTLVNKVEEPGLKSVKWDAGRLVSGVYFYRLQARIFV